jgi:hypothetical protein
MQRSRKAERRASLLHNPIKTSSFTASPMFLSPPKNKKEQKDTIVEHH